MKIKRKITENILMTGDEVKKFITRYIEKKTGKKVKDIELSGEDYEISIEDVYQDEDMGE
jgi:hypothetical protein